MDGTAIGREVGAGGVRRYKVPAPSGLVTRGAVLPATADWVLPEPGPIQVALIAPQDIGQSLGAFLRTAGMSVQIWSTPAAFEGSAEAPVADIVIVDASAFGADAYSLMARLRSTLAIGAVMLVAGGRRTDRMLALSLGADHCMPNPPDPQELEVCLRNLHRRVRPPMPVIVDPLPPAVAAGTLRTWSFDGTEWRLTAPNGRSTSMSMTDHHVVRRLLHAPGTVVSRSDLLQELEQNGIKVGSRNLDMIISRLRKKVAKDCGERLPVRSARSIGYVFAGQCEVRPVSVTAVTTAASTGREVHRARSPRSGG